VGRIAGLVKKNHIKHGNKTLVSAFLNRSDLEYLSVNYLEGVINEFTNN
jgi:hypothetical protein